MWAAAQQDPGFQELHLLGCWDRSSGARGDLERIRRIEWDWAWGAQLG